MKTPPRSASFQMVHMKRVVFLNAVLQRLQDDVGTIFDLISAHNHQVSQHNERTIGFWAGLRMLLPIIEAISHAQDIPVQELIGNHLNIPVPNLAWDLFRHSLTHGDYIQHGIYQGKVVNWGVSFMGGGHIVQAGHIGIDLTTLYEDLVDYLEREIANNDQTIIDIETGVEYGAQGARGQVRQEIIDDFARL